MKAWGGLPLGAGSRLALMRARFAQMLAVLLISGFATACSSSKQPDAGPMDGAQPTDGPAAVFDGGPTADLDASFDTGIVPGHDAGGPVFCATTCACPRGMGCIEGLCRDLGTPVWCCQDDDCPSRAVCLDAQDRPGQCPDLDVPDAGMASTDPGQLGDDCAQDSQCDSARNLSCWVRNEPPFIWGYCTVEGCVGGCPSGSECLSFGDANRTQGCLKTCHSAADCGRKDAHCREIPGAAFGGVCLPDCRDDLLDCQPRDGSRYCSPLTGQCELTPMQSASGQVGDPCDNATQCGAGQTCLTEAGWSLPAGLCTQVCRGLPEASACPFGTTCLDFAGVGLCFADCVADQCPNRPGAMCDRLDSSWPSPACIVQ